MSACCTGHASHCCEWFSPAGLTAGCCPAQATGLWDSGLVRAQGSCSPQGIAGPPNLARRAKARQLGPLRLRSGCSARRHRASWLCADRHDQRHRALPPPHPVLAHSRISPRRPRPAQSVDKSVFEYWTHALAYVPSARLPLLPAGDEALRDRAKPLVRLGRHPADVQGDAERIREGGPLSIRDIDDDELVEKNHPWASRKPSKRALQLAFYHGRVTVSARAGMLKTYELMERHFGWTDPAQARHRAAGPRLSARSGAARAGRRQPRFRSAISMRRPSRRVRALIEAASGASCWSPVAIEGAGKVAHWATPEALDALVSRAAAPLRPHPLAVRSAGDPAQAAEAVLRLRPHVRGLCADREAPARLFRAAGAAWATGSSRRSI